MGSVQVKGKCDSTRVRSCPCVESSGIRVSLASVAKSINSPRRIESNLTEPNRNNEPNIVFPTDVRGARESFCVTRACATRACATKAGRATPRFCATWACSSSNHLLLLLPENKKNEALRLGCVVTYVDYIQVADGLKKSAPC